MVGKEYGFRVHRVEANSPGQQAGLQSILDYVVVANGVRLNHDDGSFVRMIAESKGQPMRLLVFDTHTLRTRETVLTPSDGWGGTGLVGQLPPGGARDDVWRRVATLAPVRCHLHCADARQDRGARQPQSLSAERAGPGAAPPSPPPPRDVALVRMDRAHTRGNPAK